MPVLGTGTLVRLCAREWRRPGGTLVQQWTASARRPGDEGIHVQHDADDEGSLGPSLGFLYAPMRELRADFRPSSSTLVVAFAIAFLRLIILLPPTQMQPPARPVCMRCCTKRACTRTTSTNGQSILHDAKTGTHPSRTRFH